MTILARPQGSKNAFSDVGGGSLTTGQSTFGFSGGVRPGKWQVEVSYSDPGRLLSSTSTSLNVTVPAASTTVSFNKISVKNGNLTVSGKLSQEPDGVERPGHPARPAHDDGQAQQHQEGQAQEHPSRPARAVRRGRIQLADARDRQVRQDDVHDPRQAQARLPLGHPARVPPKWSADQ